MPHAYKWREDGRLSVRPRRTGVLAMHGCLEGVQALHALRTGLRGWHACPARLTVPFGTLVRVPFGTLIRVPFGTLIRVPFGTLIRVPFGTLIRVPFGTLIRVPFGTLIRVPFGTLIRVPYGTLIRVPFGTLIRVLFGTLIRVPFGTLIRVPFGTLIRVQFGTLIRVPFGTLIRVPNGTLIRVPFGTLIRVPNGTLIRVPFGTLIRVPFGTLIRVPFGTLIRVPFGTLIRVPFGTLIRVLFGTLIRVPFGTLIRVPSGTLIRVPFGTLIRVPNGTLIRAPRGSRKPLNLRGLREPGRAGVPAVHTCPEGVQGLHALQTGVHGQHACPAGPHAEPAVLTPFAFGGGCARPLGVPLSSPQTKSPSEVAANAARNSNCHICRQPGHWAADCPIGKKPPPQKPISWQQRNPTAFPNGYSPYCPIVVAPNFLPYGSPYPIPNFTQPHQIPTPPNKQLSPTPPTNPQGRPYESYKPSYPRQHPDVTTKNVEVGNIKDEIAELQLHGKVTADAVSAQPEIITDTGATNHLTGDKLALSEFKTLSSLIPLRVATEGCSNFITGVGTMSFPGKNGMTVSVKGMMYCEQASSTLISPAALRRANVRIAYDSTAQTIVSDGYICGYVGRFEPMLHCRDISSVWLDATLALVDTTPVLLDANTLLVDIVLVIVDAIPAILDAILHQDPGQAIVTNILPELPPPLEIVPTTFLAGPAPRLREAFLLKQDSCFFSTLPSNLLTEVDALKERIVRQQHTV
ncbi:hypothetical protein PCANC_14557 [Puccinia coronata f. sp. avenae]|uniref:CCHC-type domain-containing protein n=1 Tax=Puccinia coronata f. sp. avenae TaxID=200324 RepID=A0A2N5UJW8_9BASI|nr:hypothetical protein PCANC_14557 [Puccinia coronata f. sp. avenae]